MVDQCGQGGRVGLDGRVRSVCGPANDLEPTVGHLTPEAVLAEPQLVARSDPLGNARVEYRQANLRPKLYMYVPRNHGSSITCIK
jgi:hypothetical protein